MSTDFLDRLERQLLAAATRELAAPPPRWRGHRDPRRPRPLTRVPVAAALACVALVAAIALSLAGEERRPAPSQAVPARSVPAPPASPAPGTISVLVLNGTRRDGVAAARLRRLELAGFVSAGTGNASRSDVRVSRVYAERRAAGERVAVALGLRGRVRPPSPELRAAGADADVIVLLGRDAPP